MNQRPKIEIQHTKLDITLENISFLLLVAFTVFSIYSFFTLPKTIPIHFNASGQPDGYGSKYFIFLLLAIGIGMYVLLTFVSKKPHWYNYPVKITEENAKKQYTYAARMLRFMKVAVLSIFLFLASGTYTTALEKTNGIGNKSLFFITLIVGAIVAKYFYQSVRKSW